MNSRRIASIGLAVMTALALMGYGDIRDPESLVREMPELAK